MGQPVVSGGPSDVPFGYGQVESLKKKGIIIGQRSVGSLKTDKGKVEEKAPGAAQKAENVGTTTIPQAVAELQARPDLHTKSPTVAPKGFVSWTPAGKKEIEVALDPILKSGDPKAIKEFVKDKMSFLPRTFSVTTGNIDVRHCPANMRMALHRQVAAFPELMMDVEKFWDKLAEDISKELTAARGRGGSEEATKVFASYFPPEPSQGVAESKKTEVPAELGLGVKKEEKSVSGLEPKVQERRFSPLSLIKSAMTSFASKAKAAWASVWSPKVEEESQSEGVVGVGTGPAVTKGPVPMTVKELAMEGIRTGWEKKRLEEKLLVDLMSRKEGAPGDWESKSWEEQLSLAKEHPELKEKEYSALLSQAKKENTISETWESDQKVKLLKEWNEILTNPEKKGITFPDEKAFKELERDMLGVVFSATLQLESDKVMELRVGVFKKFVNNNSDFFKSIGGSTFITKSNDDLKAYINGKKEDLKTMVDEHKGEVLEQLKSFLEKYTGPRDEALFTEANRFMGKVKLPGMDEEGNVLYQVCKRTLLTEVLKKMVDEGFSPPSAKSYIEKFSIRGWVNDIPYKAQGEYKTHISGYSYTPTEHDLDKQELEGILFAHNKKFEKDLAKLDSPQAEGLLAKQDVSSETEIFVRADLHSDLRSLLTQLKLLQSQGKLDENFHCTPGFKMVFLGDYVDRGHNDIEMLSLIMKLRTEDPENILFIRGNHEDPNLHNVAYSEEEGWMTEHKSELAKCYKSLPVAIYMGTEGGVAEKAGREEYMQFSHAGFSIDIDPTDFLRGKEPLAFIKKGDSFERIKGEKEKLTGKQQAAAERLKKAQEAKEKVRTKRTEEGFMEYDIVSQGEEGMDSTGFQADPDGKERQRLSPELFHAHAQMGDTGEKEGVGEAVGGARIKGFVRGHTHEFKEYEVARIKVEEGETTKVIGTTLSVGAAGGEFGKKLGEASLTQGFLLKVKPRVRDWEKTPVHFEGKGKELKMVLGEQTVTMYKKVPPRAPVGAAPASSANPPANPSAPSRPPRPEGYKPPRPPRPEGYELPLPPREEPPK